MRDAGVLELLVRLLGGEQDERTNCWLLTALGNAASDVVDGNARKRSLAWRLLRILRSDLTQQCTLTFIAAMHTHFYCCERLRPSTKTKSSRREEVNVTM